MDVRVEVPKKLTKQTLYDEFGMWATDYYIDRMKRRIEEGKIYLNPLKTVYLWMVEDKAKGGGYWRKHYSHNGAKKKNHGRT